MPNEDRFWRRVLKTETCWLWTGYATPDGYGRTHGVRVHRRVYTELVGPIPEGLEIDHLCGVTLCCNPEHLEPVTRAENVRRRVARKRGNPPLATPTEIEIQRVRRSRSHCEHGHEMTPENTRISDGVRVCRTCNRIRSAKHRARAAS